VHVKINTFCRFNFNCNILWTLGFRTSYFEVVTFEQNMVMQNTVKKEQAVQGEWGESLCL